MFFNRAEYSAWSRRKLHSKSKSKERVHVGPLRYQRRACEPGGFQTITASVSIDAAVPRRALDALLRLTVLWSLVGNTLYNPVGLDVHLAAEQSARVS